VNIFDVPRALLTDTFTHFRQCSAGRRECQVLWLSAWSQQGTISHVVHPRHRSHAGGFEVGGTWLNNFWAQLADRNLGVRVQVHTHPEDAFHSPTDDDWPIVHTPGFLSLVIPNFGLGPVGLDRAFLAEFDQSGCFRAVSIGTRLAII
jgi:hypothetical protein